MPFLAICPKNCGLSIGCPACRLDESGNFTIGDPITPKGWECPKCAKVYGPHMNECESCNVNKFYFGTGTLQGGG